MPLALQLSAELTHVQAAALVDPDALKEEIKTLMLQVKAAKKETDSSDSKASEDVKRFVADLNNQLTEVNEEVRVMQERVRFA